MTVNDTAAIVERIRGVLKAHPTLNSTTLGDAVGMDKSKVSKMLNGSRSVSAAEAAAIADALGESATWIVTGRRPSPPRPRAVAARLATETAADFPEASARAAELLEVRALLEQLVVLAAPEPPVVQVPTTNFHIRAGAECAKNLRAALGIGDQPIADISALIENNFRVDVSRQPMDDNLAGLLIRDTEQPALEATALMLVNSACGIGRQRFTAAHELAHLLFADTGLLKPDYVHHESDDWDEVRADAFAAELLAPQTAVDTLAATLGAKPAADSDGWVARLVASIVVTFGLSVESALLRALKLNHIDEDEYRAGKGRYARDLMVSGGHPEAADAVIAHDKVIDPPAALTGQALHAYAEGMVGIGTLAALYHSDDPVALRHELAQAGWEPAFA